VRLSLGHAADGGTLAPVFVGVELVHPNDHLSRVLSLISFACLALATTSGNCYSWRARTGTSDRRAGFGGRHPVKRWRPHPIRRPTARVERPACARISLYRRVTSGG